MPIPTPAPWEPHVKTQSRKLFKPYGNADKELEWFFTMAESDMGTLSNYVESLTHVSPSWKDDDTMDKRVEAAHAQRTLLKWVGEVGDFDAGVLQAAYTARPWPLMLREEFGRLTGVIVRLATVDTGLPNDPKQLDALERRTAIRLTDALARRDPIFERVVPKGNHLLKTAFDAYVRERGGKEKPVLRGVR
jgi:hypothetical protein